MNHVNVLTMLLIKTPIMLIMGVAILFLCLVSRPVPGLRRCGIGTLLLCLGSLLMILKAVGLGNGIVFLSNVATFAGAIVLLQGLRAFRGRPPVPAFALGVGAALSLGACGYWLFVRDDMTARIAAVSPFLAVLSFVAAATMASGVAPEDRLAYWATAFAFAADGVVLVGRTAEALLTNLGDDPLAPKTLEVANALVFNVAAPIIVLGLIVSAFLRIQREIETFALTDPLTRLLNRRGFEERFELARRRAARSGGRLALFYMDLDEFKTINDRLGHEAGDEALRIVASRLASVVRRSDGLARLAGDEFALLLEDVQSLEEVAELRRRLKAAVGGDAEWAGKPMTLRISCGSAVFPDEVDDPSALLGKADAAMYEDKATRPAGERQDPRERSVLSNGYGVGSNIAGRDLG